MSESEPSSFVRTPDWTYEEVMLAWSACPKDSQRYGPSDPLVRELADLLGRSPSAVSRKFGNLWAARTEGKSGLRHFGATCLKVVSDFEGREERLRQEASAVRARLFERAPSPRLEVQVSDADRTRFQDLILDFTQADKLRRFQILTYVRSGSVRCGVLLQLSSCLSTFDQASALASTVDTFVSTGLEQIDPARPPLRSTLWELFKRHDLEETLAFTIRRYLPAIHLGELDRPSQLNLARFVANLEGIRPQPEGSQRSKASDRKTATGQSASRKRRALSKALGCDFSRLCSDCIDDLDELVGSTKRGILTSVGRTVESGRTTVDQYDPRASDW
jgi:hypothetical protein